MVIGLLLFTFMCMVDTLLSNYFQFFQMQMKRNGGGEFLTLTLNDDDVCVTDVSDDESLHLDNDVEEMVEVAPGILGLTLTRYCIHTLNL